MAFLPTVVQVVTRSQTNRCVAILASKPQVERKTLSIPGYSEDCKSLARSLEQGIQGRQIARKQSLHGIWFLYKLPLLLVGIFANGRECKPTRRKR